MACSGKCWSQCQGNCNCGRDLNYNHHSDYRSECFCPVSTEFSLLEESRLPSPQSESWWALLFINWIELEVSWSYNISSCRIVQGAITSTKCVKVVAKSKVWSCKMEQSYQDFTPSASKTCVLKRVIVSFRSLCTSICTLNTRQSSLHSLLAMIAILTWAAQVSKALLRINQHVTRLWHAGCCCCCSSCR